jgi:hypothetical protein
MGREQTYNFINDGVDIVERDVSVETVADKAYLGEAVCALINRAYELLDGVVLEVPDGGELNTYTHMLGRVATAEWGPPEYALVKPSLAGASAEAAARACERLEVFGGGNCLGFVFVEPLCPDEAPPQHFAVVEQKMQELGLVVAHVMPAQQETLSVTDTRPVVDQAVAGVPN